MKNAIVIAAAIAAAAIAGAGQAEARCGCVGRHVAHGVVRHHGAAQLARRHLSTPITNAAGLLGHAQWDVEVLPGRHLAPLDGDVYLPTPGEPGFEARVPVSLGWGGVVTPPLRLPVRRGYDGLK